jgi:hypothetical protein
MIRSYAAAVKNISPTGCVASGTTNLSAAANVSVEAPDKNSSIAAASVNDSFPPFTQPSFSPGRMVKAPRPSDSGIFAIVTSRQERPRLPIFKDLEMREQEFTSAIDSWDSCGADSTPAPTTSVKVKDKRPAANTVPTASVKVKRSPFTETNKFLA